MRIGPRPRPVGPRPPASPTTKPRAFLLVGVACLLAAAAPASAEIDAPCTARYDLYEWPVLGAPLILGEVGLECVDLVQFQDVQNPP